MALPSAAQEMLQQAARAASDALAEDIVAIDVTGVLPFSDAFLIVTADNPRHVRGIMSAVGRDLQQKLGTTPTDVEGDQGSEWVLMDYGDIVVHVFLPESREFYALDKLWGDSPRVGLDLGVPEDSLP